MPTKQEPAGKKKKQQSSPGMIEMFGNFRFV
jgi:hypothetical protein